MGDISKIILLDGSEYNFRDSDGARKSDLTSIFATGTTNTSGTVIAKGKYFYLNGTLVQALAPIAVNATFTSGTNYEAVTAGALNSLIVSAANDLTYASLSNYNNGSMKLYVLQKNFYFFSFSLGLKDVVAGTTVCTIDDASIRPISGFWMTIQIINSSNQFQNARIVVGTDGAVKIYDVSGTISISGCWCGVV